VLDVLADDVQRKHRHQPLMIDASPTDDGLCVRVFEQHIFGNVGGVTVLS
jgi:hypothetical protein